MKSSAFDSVFGFSGSILQFPDAEKTSDISHPDLICASMSLALTRKGHGVQYFPDLIVHKGTNPDYVYNTYDDKTTPFN